MFQEKDIRAFYTDQSIRVYQAYNDLIANSAIQHQKFVSPPFKTDRTTWIKPSFLWMMYRSGWGTKQNQQRILAIDITHEGFRWVIQNSCLSHFDPSIYSNYEQWEEIKESAAVIIQWDPERDIFLNKLNYRAIQIGLRPSAVNLYIGKWIVNITDATNDVRKIKSLIDKKKVIEAQHLLPIEKSYILNF